MRKITAIMVAFAAFGLLTLGMTGVASAASIGCGQCHGSKGIPSGFRAGYESTPTTEDSKTPVAEDICNNNGRGLHGIHMNYSSVSYGKTGTTTRGTCNYCHNRHVHVNGFVEFSGYNPASAMGQIKTVSITNGGTGWTAGDVNNTYVTIAGGDGNGEAQITGVTGGAVTAVSVGAHGHSKGSGYSTATGVTATEEGGSRTFTLDITAISNTGLRQSVNSTPVKVTGTGIGANGLDITAMDGNATCTTACHKGTSATNPAPWGNYTSASIVLSCTSCHGDASNDGATASIVPGYTLSSPLSGTTNYGHKIHLTGSWLGTGINIKSGGSTIGVMKQGAANGNTNAVCALCHPDNSGDGKMPSGTADFGAVKAYPHASDGTNVLPSNAALNTGVITGLFRNSTAASPGAPSTSDLNAGTFGCTNICHSNRSPVMLNNPNWARSAPTGGTSTGCEACHNHNFSAAVNNASSRKLSFAHSLHFAQLSSPTYHGSSACSTDCHGVASLHTNYNGVVNLVQLPVLDGTAGLGSGAGYSAAGTISVSGTCTNRCHILTSPTWDSIATGSTTAVAGCAACHEYPGAATDWTGNNGHTVRAAEDKATAPLADGSISHLNATATYNALTDTYAGVTGDKNQCGICHKGGTHMSGTKDVYDHYSSGTACSTSFTFNAISSATSNKTCSSTKCHFGRQTPNWN